MDEGIQRIVTVQEKLKIDLAWEEFRRMNRRKELSRLYEELFEKIAIINSIRITEHNILKDDTHILFETYKHTIDKSRINDPDYMGEIVEKLISNKIQPTAEELSSTLDVLIRLYDDEKKILKEILYFLEYDYCFNSYLNIQSEMKTKF